MSAPLIRVGMADLAVTHNPGILVTVGLGSCVGIVCYDPRAKLGGMAHAMLPCRNSSRARENPAKFADSALPLLVEELTRLGARHQRLEARLVGGAQMFTTRGQGSEILRIGEKNVEAALEALRQAKIRLVAQDTGGDYGRTVHFDTSTGQLRVRTMAQGEKIL